jgi:hypothetical protein
MWGYEDGVKRKILRSGAVWYEASESANQSVEVGGGCDDMGYKERARGGTLIEPLRGGCDREW